MWERLQEALAWKPRPCRGGLGSEDPSARRRESSHLQQGQDSLVCHSLLPSKRGPVWNKDMSPLAHVHPNRASAVRSAKGCGYPAGQKGRRALITYAVSGDHAAPEP